MDLSPHDRAILDLEREWELDGAAKLVAIRQRLDMSATRYHQELGLVIDQPAALDYDPLLVRRLRRTRLAGRRVRFGGRPIEERSRP